MLNENYKFLASDFLSTFRGRVQSNFFDKFDCSEVQRELMKITDSEELANWFHNFNPGLSADFSLLTWIASIGDEDAILYEFMKKVISLDKEIVVADRSPDGGDLLVEVIPDRENPSVIVDWFEYSESSDINNDFCMKICNNDIDDCSIRVISQKGDCRNNAFYVAITAGRFYGALDSAIKDSKNYNNVASSEKDCYTLIKKK